MVGRDGKSPSSIAIGLAFAAVYVIWGSTYLAIRVAVETMPPFTMAGVRFFSAGIVLYTFLRIRGVARPSRRQWRSTAIIGVFLLLGGNGGVTWAEQYVPSALACLLVTTVPLWMVLLNWWRPGGVRPAGVEVLGVALGFVGVVILVDPGIVASTGGVDRMGALALLCAAFLWSTGSIYARGADLPRSALLATGMEMIIGGSVLLAVGGLFGEWGRIDLAAISMRSIMALIYLITFGALIGYSCYTWLLGVTTPARVATYAYVNPIIAVILGWAILSEPITTSTLLAMVVIIGAVALITIRRTQGAAKNLPNKTESCHQAPSSTVLPSRERSGGDMVIGDTMSCTLEGERCRADS